MNLNQKRAEILECYRHQYNKLFKDLLFLARNNPIFSFDKLMVMFADALIEIKEEK